MFYGAVENALSELIQQAVRDQVQELKRRMRMKIGFWQ